MKKAVSLVLFLCAAGGLGLGFFLLKNQILGNTPLQVMHTGSINVSSTTGSIQENNTVALEKTKEELVRDKIQSIKKRLALKESIIQGDAYFRENQLALALREYLDFYKQNPDDTLIHEKIGDTYFSMKKFSSALNYYKKTSSTSQQQRNKIVQALFYVTDFKKEGEIGKLREELRELDLSSEEYFYYDTSLLCMNDFHACKLNFQEYFWPTIGENTATKILFPPLQDIRISIENYRNFQVDQVYLKDALLVGSWYSHDMYPLSILIGEQILGDKIDYKPVLKIVAQSYFEMGEYEKSRDVFGDYYEIDDNDAVVAYMLGIINSKLREYVLANIYFYKALNLQYTPSIDIRRHIIYNFYLLENTENMFKAFGELIENEDIETEDLRIAIYYAIVYEKYELALDWSQKGQTLFPEGGDFYTYEGWILRDTGDFKAAQEILQNAIKIDGENPFVLINNAYNEKAMGNLGIAHSLFKKVIELAPKSDFASQSQKEIDTLNSGL